VYENKRVKAKKGLKMTSEKELKLSYDELTRIVWTCSGCGAEQGLNISSKKQAVTLVDNYKIFKCGMCGQLYDSRLFPAFQSLFNFHDGIKHSGCNVFFRVSVKDKKEEESKQ
jgi:transcription elongation factor Elf1